MKVYHPVKVASVTALVAGSLALAAPVAAQDALTFGTSSIGSVFYVISVGMSKLIGKHAGINVTVQPVGGSYPNLFALADGKVDLAMANSLSQYDRYHGNAPFKKPFEVRVVAQGQPNFRVLLVRRGSKIQKVSDLSGKTFIGKRRALPELTKITSALLRAHKIPAKSVKVVGTVNTGQVVKALRAGTVDGAAYPAARKQPLLTSLFQDKVVDFLDLSSAQRDEMLKTLPGAFYPATLKKGSFPNQDKDAQVFGLYTVLVTRANVPADTIYKVTKAILGNPKEFSKYHAAARQWTVKQSMSNLSVPLHPGAIRYFKEVGTWNVAMEKKQAALLKRK